MEPRLRLRRFRLDRGSNSGSLDQQSSSLRTELSGPQFNLIQIYLITFVQTVSTNNRAGLQVLNNIVTQYSRTSTAQALMARLPRLFGTRSGVPWKKSIGCRFGIIFDDFLIHIENGILCVLIRIASILMRTHNIPSC